MFCRDFIPRGEEVYVCKSCLSLYAGNDAGAVALPEGGFCLYALPYEKGIRRAILQLKFHHKRLYARPLAAWLTPLVERQERIDVVSWVPTNPLRCWLRGYNQAKLIAVFAARDAGLPAQGLLYRLRLRPPQPQARDRYKNVAGVIHLCRNADVAGKRVLLIDDIVTSGATLVECRRVLLDAGARDVVCLALAHHDSRK